MKPGSAAVFKFAVTASGNNVTAGSDVIIHGPWTSRIAGNGDEIVTRFDRCELSENSDIIPKKFPSKILFESDCRCVEKSSVAAADILSRSKSENLDGPVDEQVRDP